MKSKLSFFCQDCGIDFKSNKHFKLPNGFGNYCHCPKCNYLCNNSYYFLATQIYNFAKLKSKQEFDNNDSITSTKITFYC